MNIHKIEIRQTNTEDFNSIMMVEERAFGYDKEAKLTADLLSDTTAEPVLSLLAFYEGKAVGHILFTRAYLNDMNTEQSMIHILAPLAVIPEFQKQGVGGLLIKEGLKRLKQNGTEIVFVLGHMEYYPKYGFIPDAGKMGYEAPYPIPEEVADAWMVQSLNSEGFMVKPGRILCCKELHKPEHWRE